MGIFSIQLLMFSFLLTEIATKRGEKIALFLTTFIRIFAFFTGEIRFSRKISKIFKLFFKHNFCEIF